MSIIDKEKGGTKIGSVMALAKGMSVPDQFNPTIYFSLDSFDQTIFDGLSEGIKKIIMQSPEYMAITKNEITTAVDNGHPYDDDIPF